ncbi:hypothetical protein AVEN_98102-1 [Araneus ventricosus]|uniref:Uncharacterized protein n=1 Tax=Araneus ventricosus TaxID=182803 RepID=A0A4Y2USK4_ARAVE|nr:hypothetical protein AVEN_98102-1 [Araneus ventricosus]
MTTMIPEHKLPSASFSTTPPGGCLTSYVCEMHNTRRICSGTVFQAWKPSGSKAGILPLGYRGRKEKKKKYLSQSLVCCQLISPNSRSHKHRPWILNNPAERSRM